MVSPSTVVNYAQYLPEFLQRLRDDTAEDIDEFDEHVAFEYLIAREFGGYLRSGAESFIYTNGPNEQGIDFAIKDDSSWTIYQAKIPDLDGLESENQPHTFNGSPLEQLETGIEFILDPDGNYASNQPVNTIRTEYHRDSSTNLTAVLAVFGTLTGPAKTNFTQAQDRWLARGVTLRLIDSTTVLNQMFLLPSQESFTGEIKLTYNDGIKESMRHNDYCLVLAKGYDLVKAFEDHEWALFDLNVRLKLKGSKINQKIVKSLKQARGRRNFHHINNGILIVCDRYAWPNREKAVNIHRPQIINGCQTVSSLHTAYHELSPADQRHFEENVRVQVKILQNSDTELIDELVISTNDQNPMNARNLQSNTSDQRLLQERFRGITPKWFFERRDGEFSSLKERNTRVTWFRTSDYRSTTGIERKIDNQILAKVWYSLIGFGARANTGGVDYFDGAIYDTIFKRSPNSAYWSYIKDPRNSGSLDPGYYDTGTVSPYQYSVALMLTQYVDAKKLTGPANRLASTNRGIEAGRLFESSSPAEINEWIAGDDEYKLENHIGNAKEQIIELMGLALMHKYGDLNPTTCEKFLNNPEEKIFFEAGFSKAAAPLTGQNGDRIVGPTFDYVKYCFGQHFMARKAEIMAAPRAKSYYWSPDVITRLRNSVVQNLSQGGQSGGLGQPWASPPNGFLDSLPPL